MSIHVITERFEKVELPSGYTQLSHIQSSGTQWIDTGFKPNQDTRVVASFTMMQTDSKWYKLWGSGNGSYTNDFALWASGTTKLQLCYGNQTPTISCDGGHVYADANKNVWNTDGVTTTLTSQTLTCNYPMYIFSVNKDTNSSYLNAKIRLETFKVYDNGTLVRDFIPCLNASNVAGLYDLVGGKFYTNAGTGVFITGEPIGGNIPHEVAEVSVIDGGTIRDFKSGYVIENGTIYKVFGGETFPISYSFSIQTNEYNYIINSPAAVGLVIKNPSGGVRTAWIHTYSGSAYGAIDLPSKYGWTVCDKASASIVLDAELGDVLEVWVNAHSQDSSHATKGGEITFKVNGAALHPLGGTDANNSGAIEGDEEYVFHSLAITGKTNISISDGGMSSSFGLTATINITMEG